MRAAGHQQMKGWTVFSPLIFGELIFFSKYLEEKRWFFPRCVFYKFTYEIKKTRLYSCLNMHWERKNKNNFECTHSEFSKIFTVLKHNYFNAHMWLIDLRSFIVYSTLLTWGICGRFWSHYGKIRGRDLHRTGLSGERHKLSSECGAELKPKQI